MDLKVKDFHMLSHMSMTTKHVLTQIGTFDAVGHKLNDRQFIIVTTTPVRKNGDFGNGKSKYYLNESKSPMFNTINELIKHYSDPEDAF